MAYQIDLTRIVHGEIGSIFEFDLETILKINGGKNDRQKKKTDCSSRWKT